MRITGPLAVAMLLACAPGAQAAEHVHRAHEHGSGILNVAVEGGTVEVELIAPGSDIVGFEHRPASDDDREAVEKAASLLADGAGIFVFPESAGCTLTEASLDSGLLEEHAVGGHGADENGEHAEFHARYRFDCATPESLDAMDLRYFDLFPAARELDASLLTETGQTAAELTPDAARLDL